MKIDLTGRVAIVTGAAKGIGEKTAHVLSEAGAAVVIADILDEPGRKVAEEIGQEGGKALFIHADLSQEAEIEDMVAGTVQHFGRLDILVNNAHFEVAGGATELSADDWDRSMAVLLKAIFLGAKYAIPHMKAVGGGSIVNIASVLGHRPTPRYLTYVTAKAAIASMSRQLALDYGPDGIRVNTVTPGPIYKAKKFADSPDRESKVAQRLPLRRTGIPADVAYAVCFLVSDQASFITGADLFVDGGQTIPL